MEAMEDRGAPVAEAAVVLPLPPDEAMIVDVTSGLDGHEDRAGEEHPREAAGDHWEQSNVKGLVSACLSVGTLP